jgi:hypothetical protein
MNVAVELASPRKNVCCVPGSELATYLSKKIGKNPTAIVVMKP